jgi:outer membrane protein assembly factor BamA
VRHGRRRPIVSRVFAFAAALALPLSALAQVPPVEVLREVRVHGNYTTPDQDVVRLAGLVLGEPVTAASIDAAKSRLERSGRFVAVDLRKRYTSLEPNGEVAIVIVVQEYPVPDVAPSPMRSLRRVVSGSMFMPILNYTDGYGFTYGGRLSFVDGVGKGARLSVPATWGGTKRAAVEFERAFRGRPIDRVSATASISQRTNPHYEVDDTRQEASISASKQVARGLYLGAEAGMTNVTFGDLTGRFPTYGAGVTLDTRTDPVFPRNALYAKAGWRWRGGAAGETSTGSYPGTNLLSLDARGYLGLIGQSVLSVRGQYVQADAPLPPYDQLLLGGASTLRGYRAGTFAGDTLAAASLELRMPLGSRLRFARSGVSLFADTGAVAVHGSRFGDATWHEGFGGGVFFLASIFQLNVDVAFRPGEPDNPDTTLRTGGARVHLMFGFQF